MSKFRKKAGVNGEIYPCKPDIFEMTYEAVK
jgi:hypothetical protein